MKKLFVILQLCFAFSLMLWYAGQPFLGEYFSIKSRMLLFEYVMGTSDSVKDPDKMEKNKERFNLLSNKNLIEEKYKNLLSYSQRPIWDKVGDSLKAIWAIPSFEMAWIFFTIFISIIILLKWPGAEMAAWLLPLIVIAHGLDNRTFVNGEKEENFFPSEKLIVENYLNEPLSSNIAIQREQLKRGWEKYLIDNWGKTNLEEAEYNFILARVENLREEVKTDWHKLFRDRVSNGILLIYLVWNVIFAFILNKKNKPQSAQRTQREKLISL